MKWFAAEYPRIARLQLPSHAVMSKALARKDRYGTAADLLLALHLDIPTTGFAFNCKPLACSMQRTTLTCVGLLS